MAGDPQEHCTVTRCYCSHVLLLAAVPRSPVTSAFWWLAGVRARAAPGSRDALQIAILFYITMLVAVFTVGKMIHWMGQTYGSEAVAAAMHCARGLHRHAAVPHRHHAAVSAAVWLNLLLGLPALGYIPMYLLYTGVPVMMGVPKERGFLIASAVLAVGLVMLVGVLAATVILWGADRSGVRKLVGKPPDVPLI